MEISPQDTTEHHLGKSDGQRHLAQIVERVAAWVGSEEQAIAWYQAEPLAPFGGRTAELLVEHGKANAVHEYLDHLANGGFA
ncbi:antitoxin Xre/MbcA/ParS toxin-binding domain-containing protein [Mesorhizobium sp. L-8-3]|uniref:antitoxin Xre/MbcA/ParS toxin-binding domain-containing protein n=1 Tax=Mesorhizobium sp. L-8-3 TaxID=2744522 RepID=UPI0019271DC5|nr:antitoxin Xre/MbcA/ParS toxin-binding domain-containing protein [Mesorhizobium sp. L-8-3]BCH20861.1 hypothetical protein MesoLjLb_06460 [Mesorhizobium sp. L-8-3]